MKKITKQALLLLLAMPFWACSTDDLETVERIQGGDFVLTTQQQVNAFTSSADIASLTITGSDIADLSALCIERVNRLRIVGTSVQELDLPSLTTITEEITISDNPQLERISDLGLKFVNGVFTISGNQVLTEIKGILGLKVLQGDLVVTDNPALGENLPLQPDEFGLNPIKVLSNDQVIEGEVILMNNHPDAATDVSWIGVSSVALDYTITSKQEALTFPIAGDSARRLVITGNDIDDEALAAIAGKITRVIDTIRVENTVATTTYGFFDKVKCEGSVVLRNNLNMTNPNGFSAYTSIGGDLVVDNTPLDMWNPDAFTNIVDIEGDLLLNRTVTRNYSFMSLVHVGGDFKVTNCQYVWGVPDGSEPGVSWGCDEALDGWSQLRTIGGDLDFSDNAYTTSLSLFENLASVGGNVTVMDNGSQRGWIPLESTDTKKGFDIFKKLLGAGVIGEDATLKLRRSPDEDFIDFDDLSAPSYTINGQDEAMAFDPAGKIANDLTITGGVTDEGFVHIASKLTTVKGTITLDGTQMSSTMGFFDVVSCEGSIILRNNEVYMINPNGFKAYTEIGGDLIIENSPWITFWSPDAFSNVTRVKGDLIVKKAVRLTSDAFANLEQVDGDLILSDNWLNGWVCSNYNDWKKLSVVKGNIVFTDQADINDLGCFAHLTEVGGVITISGNGWNQGYIPLVSTDVQTGFDLIKRLKDNGVFKKPGAVFTLSRSPEEGNINVDDL